MRRSIPMQLAILSMSLLLAWLSFRLAPNASADEPKVDEEKKAAKERKERYEKWMREYSEGTTINLVGEGKEAGQTAKLAAQPVFRYSGDNIFADNATLWVWTHDARPVAFQKIEVNNIGGQQQWTICFGSVYEGLFDVHWPSGRHFSSRAPGVEFRPIPEAAAPSDDAKARTRQLKKLKDRFTGRVDGHGPRGVIKYDLKPLPTPIFEYADPKTGLPLGAVFSLVNHDKGELNPVFLLLLEAKSDGDGKLRWEYAARRLTIWSARLLLDEKEVFSLPIVQINDQVHDDWTFYMLPRDFE